MNLHIFLFAGLLAISVPVMAQHAHHHDKPFQSGSTSVEIVDATLYITQPGSTVGDWKFIIRWTSTTPPTTFFWRPDGSRWMTASVTRVNGFISQNKTPVYRRESIDLKNVRKGDLLEIAPMAMGRDVMPAVAKAKPAGRIYFQRKGSSVWETAYPGEIHKILNMTVR